MKNKNQSGIVVSTQELSEFLTGLGALMLRAEVRTPEGVWFDLGEQVPLTMTPRGSKKLGSIEPKEQLLLQGSTLRVDLDTEGDILVSEDRTMYAWSCIVGELRVELWLPNRKGYGLDNWQLGDLEKEYVNSFKEVK